MIEQPGIDYADSSDLEQRLAAREFELNQLAIELSLQSQRLNDRDSEIAEREAELRRQQEQFTIESDGVATAAQSRRQLAAEFARQQTLWQEWNSAYRRSTAHLKSQLEIVEQRRADILVETARMEANRSEIQRMQAECDNASRALAEDRALAAKELAELQSQRAAFEAECGKKSDVVRVSEASSEQSLIETQTSISVFSELPDSVCEGVAEHCRKGEMFVRLEQREEALDQFAAAWELLPNPKNQWQSANSILIVAIDIFFNKGDFIAAREILREFLESCDTEIHPMILWRFGQSLFETGDFDAAYDALEAASRLHGHDLFANDDPKYLEFVRTQMIAMTPFRAENSNSPVNPPHRSPSADLIPSADAVEVRQ